MIQTLSPARIFRRSLLASTAAALLASATAARALTVSQGMPWGPGTATPPRPAHLLSCI